MNLLNPWKGNEGLLYKMRLLLWFVHGCHRKHFRIKTPFTFATDLLVMDSFAKLQIRDLAENWPALTRGLDSESISVLEKALETTLLYRHDEFLLDQKHGLPAELQKRYDCFFQYEQARLADYYHIPKKYITPEVFLFHHGLKGRGVKLLEYLKDKLFLDCGAFIGDSALVLMEYQPSRIYSFEISRNNMAFFSDVMKKNRISEERVKLIPCGTGAENKTVSFYDGNRSSTSSQVSGNSQAEIITLDSFAADKPAVGFIKADIEGAGLEMLKGMTGLLRRDRPVLSLAIYHTPEEFFEIKPTIESLNLNYQFEILRLTDSICQEIVLFAYPQELADR